MSLCCSRIPELGPPRPFLCPWEDSLLLRTDSADLPSTACSRTSRLESFEFWYRALTVLMKEDGQQFYCLRAGGKLSPSLLAPWARGISFRFRQTTSSVSKGWNPELFRTPIKLGQLPNHSLFILVLCRSKRVC